MSGSEAPRIPFLEPLREAYPEEHARLTEYFARADVMMRMGACAGYLSENKLPPPELGCAEIVLKLSHAYKLMARLRQ